MSRIGIVIIGRNEGQRLARCLASVLRAGLPVVYADSGSADNSPALARSMGIDCVELDSSRPFSAARGRNAGFHRLLQIHPDIQFVQFLDGDCELADGWLAAAEQALDTQSTIAVVAGRLLEQHPEASIYNRLCALEWHRPPGPIKATGGIFVARAQCYRNVGGMREDVIAAEDDELCLRFRQRGWSILQLDADMARHDAAIATFAQWWIRARRAGHAFAQGADLHGSSPDRHFVRDCRRLWIWGLVVPLLATVPAWWTRGLSLLLLLAYPLMCLRIARWGRRRSWSGRDAWAYAVFAMLSKFPGLLGMLQYYCRRGQAPPRIIEYKA